EFPPPHDAKHSFLRSLRLDVRAGVPRGDGAHSLLRRVDLRDGRARHPFPRRLSVSEEVSLPALRVRRAVQRFHSGDGRRGVVLLALLTTLTARTCRSPRCAPIPARDGTRWRAAATNRA